MALRNGLNAEFDHLVSLYLPADQAEEYRRITLDIAKFTAERTGTTSCIAKEDESSN